MIKNGTYTPASTNSANNFSNSHKTKLIAAAVYNQVPYLKKAHSYMSQSELEGKKYGRTYSVYIPDPGKAVEGLEADPDVINEVEVTVQLDNIHTSVELDAWNKLVDEESFRDEIAKPHGNMLGRALEKRVIEKTIFDAAQVAIGDASFATLSDAAGMLDEAGVAGTKVSFAKPTVMSKISNSGLAKFIPSDIQKDIYKSKYLGEYAGASQIEDSLLPTVDFTGATNVTVNLTAIKDADDNVIGFEPIKNIGTGLKAGWAYTVAGLKIVDKTGIQVDQDRAIVVKNTNGDIAELRIVVEGKTCNNANAWVADGSITSLTLVPVKTSGEYFVGQVRTESALGFDTYKFADLPGSENSTEECCGITVKMSQYGDGKKMQTFVRLDIPHAVCLPDAREAVVMYFEK